MELLLILFYIILSIIGALFLFLLLIPLKYSLDGGYNNFFSVNFNLFCTPLLGIRGNWNSIPEKPLQVQIIAAGLPLGFKPEKRGKEKKKKERKRGKSFSISTVLRSLDRKLIESFLAFLRDFLEMLMPDKLKINGRFGFSEPHYNGWLAALACILNESYGAIKLEIEPVWEEEHCEFSFIIEGRVILCIMLFRAARFLLARRTREFIKIMRKERASYTA